MIQVKMVQMLYPLFTASCVTIKLACDNFQQAPGSSRTYRPPPVALTPPPVLRATWLLTHAKAPTGRRHAMPDSTKPDTNTRNHPPTGRCPSKCGILHQEAQHLRIME